MYISRVQFFFSRFSVKKSMIVVESVPTETTRRIEIYLTRRMAREVRIEHNKRGHLNEERERGMNETVEEGSHEDDGGRRED